MYFCSKERILMKKAGSRILCTNLYTNLKYELGSNIKNNFVSGNLKNILYIMYSEENGNLYFAEFLNNKFNARCILERKSGDGEVKPYGAMVYNNKKWYVYSVLTDGQELIALHRENDIPETIASGNDILFDYCVVANKIYFCFNDNKNIVIKVYNMDSDKWETSKIINCDFEKVVAIKCFENIGKLNVLVAGAEKDLISMKLYTNEYEKYVAKYIAKDESLEFMCSFNNGILLCSNDKYIMLKISGETVEYPTKEYTFYKVLFENKILGVALKKTDKAKRELEIYTLKYKASKKINEKILRLKHELELYEKESDKIIDEINNVY